MKQYKIIVNGTEYEVAIEEIDASEVKAAAPAAAPKAAVPAGGEKVTAPIPGNILSFKVADGASVKAGDVVAILEAMKMENEILAPCDGKVHFAVASGATVATGDLIFTVN